jgi:hypothetical protein
VYAHSFSDSCVNMVDTTPYWRDVGTVDAFWEANMDLTSVVPELNLYDDDWPILSLQRQLAPPSLCLTKPGAGGKLAQRIGVQRLHCQRRHRSAVHPVLQSQGSAKAV